MRKALKTNLRVSFLLVAMALAFAQSADAAPKKAKQKEKVEAVEPAPAQEETLSEEDLNAKLVVDPTMTEAQFPNEAAANMAGAATVNGLPTEIPAEALPQAAKIDTNKLPENEIPVLAAKPEEKKAAGNQLHRIMITLLVLAAALGAALFYLKRFAAKKNGVNKDQTKIRVLAQHNLGTKKALMIVQVAGESMLIGVTDQNISMIKSLALIDDEVPMNVPNSFDGALHDMDDADDEGPDFAVRGISEIRDTVSSRVKSMRNN